MVLETNATIIDAKYTVGVLTDSFSAGVSVAEEMTTPKSIDDCLEAVVAWIEAKAGKNYFVGPLEEFLAKYGKVNPEDEFYQARMNYFLEQCVLERPMTGDLMGLAPVSKFLSQYQNITRGTTSEAEIWTNFSGFKHGIFEVLKSESDCLNVRDLISDVCFEIVPKAGETLKYLRRKSIFQCFVFGNLQQRYLGQGLIVHPDNAAREILKYIKTYKKYPSLKPSDLMRLFAATNMRFMRMQHVDPAVIYASIS